MRDLDGTPNVLRVVIGEAANQQDATQVVVIECEIDDMNPQIFGVLMDQLYAARCTRCLLCAGADEEKSSWDAA